MQRFVTIENIQGSPDEAESIGRQVVDEVIYRCQKVRGRLILELQARRGLRIGEVLNLRASDVNARRLTLRHPKSAREEESAFMPETLAMRLKGYIEAKSILPDDRLFPICYSTARPFVLRLGEKVNVKIRPHDLRLHSATYASRTCKIRPSSNTKSTFSRTLNPMIPER